MTKQIVLDLEFTQIDVKTERIYEVGMVEFEDFKPTGKSYNSLVNPEKPLVNTDSFTHQMTDEELADKPKFEEIAQEVADFIGDKKIYVTCRTTLPNDPKSFFTATWENMEAPEGSYTADVAFLNMEMEKAGLKPFPKEQWANVRRMFEIVMGEQNKAGLSNVLNHCGFKKEDFGTAHRAEDDALMLAAVLPQMLKEFEEKRKKHDKET